MIAEPDQTLTPDQYKTLPSRKEPTLLQKLQHGFTDATQNASSKPGPDQPIQDKKPTARQWFKEQKTLTLKEVSELREPLIGALIDDFGYLDEGIHLWAMSDVKTPIWGDIDQDEAGILADIMLKRGQRSPKAAAAVRALVDSDIYLQVAAIIGPRAIRTYQTVKGSPRPALNRQRREARQQILKEKREAYARRA